MQRQSMASAVQNEEVSLYGDLLLSLWQAFDGGRVSENIRIASLICKPDSLNCGSYCDQLK